MSRVRTPALLALTCAALLVPAVGAHAQAASCAGADTPAVAGNEAQLDQATLCLLNEQRAAAGLAALAENTQLDHVATAYSQQMVVVNRLTSVGYLPGNGSWAAGENIAWGEGALATPQSIMTAWMNSPDHRANILSRDYSDVGLGVAIGSPAGDTSAAATYTNDFGHHAGATGTTVSVAGTPVSHPPITVVRKKAPKRHVVTVRCARSARHLGHLTHGSAHICHTAVARAHGRKR
jgi:uncharacterized protein YkwD